MLDYLTSRQHRRFLARLVVSENPDKCILWTGSTNRGGYGTVRIGRPGRLKTVLAHRLAFFLEFGEPPEDCPFILHRCDNPPCCNPTHLFAGTKLDNAQDRDQKKRGARHDGRHNGRAKLTEADVLEIRALDNAGVKQKDIATRFNTGVKYVNDICRIRAWATLMRTDFELGKPSPY